MTFYWDKLRDIQKMQAVLNQDKVIIASGDTVLGLLGCLSEKVYQNINMIKQRSNKPCLVVIKSAKMLSRFIDQELTLELKQLVKEVWPGPVTLIFKARADLPAFMKSLDGTIALRVPDHSGLLELLNGFDGLFSTSANIHTKAIPETIEDVDKKILLSVAGQCYDAGVSSYPVTPSTILDCSSGKVNVLRAGVELSDKVKKTIKIS